MISMKYSILHTDRYETSRMRCQRKTSISILWCVLVGMKQPCFASGSLKQFQVSDCRLRRSGRKPRRGLRAVGRGVFLGEMDGIRQGLTVGNADLIALRG